MRRGAMSLGFPPFTPAVKLLVYANVAIFVVAFFADRTGANLDALLTGLFGLMPQQVVQHGWIWQLITYSFLHSGIGHILLNMLALWMFGSRLEMDWGKQRFLEFYFFCVVGAALVTVGIAYTHFLGMAPNVITVGASGGIYGLIVAFGLLYREARIYFYGIFAIPAGIFAIIVLALALFGAISERGSVNNVAHLGGALFGYIYLRALPGRGLRYATSEGYYGLLNRFHRWKRRRMARKFEVFMREHDRSKYFDEYGNYREPGPEGDPPEDNGKGQGGGGGWVN